jgi:hypothetical protein
VEPQEAVEIAIALLQAGPTADDAVILRDIVNCGVDEATAVRLVQFVPIAFTRFLYRDSGVRFAVNYVVLGPNGQPVAERPVGAEPAFREAWAYCERAAGGVAEESFVPVAARSGGYRALQELLEKGLGLRGVITSPPILWS